MEHKKVTQTMVVRESILICPQCGHATVEEMPTDSCRFFQECILCHTLIRPQKGDCCVFCSYGSVKCPPVQTEGCCGELRPLRMRTTTSQSERLVLGE